MMSGGKGGANTKTGIVFEKKTDLLDQLKKIKSLSIKGDEIFKGNRLVAVNCQKHKLYKFLASRDVNYKTMFSSRLLPDEALFMVNQNKLFIIEKKFQGGQGSVDEKLQTCAYKKQYYEKLLGSLGIEVEYIYVLSEWFAQKKYIDVLNYIEEVGCQYFFKVLPPNVLKL